MLLSFSLSHLSLRNIVPFFLSFHEYVMKKHTHSYVIFMFDFLFHSHWSLDSVNTAVIQHLLCMLGIFFKIKGVWTSLKHLISHRRLEKKTVVYEKKSFVWRSLLNLIFLLAHSSSSYFFSCPLQSTRREDFCNRLPTRASFWQDLLQAKCLQPWDRFSSWFLEVSNIASSTYDKTPTFSPLDYVDNIMLEQWCGGGRKITFPDL